MGIRLGILAPALVKDTAWAEDLFSGKAKKSPHCSPASSASISRRKAKNVESLAWRQADGLQESGAPTDGEKQRTGGAEKPNAVRVTTPYMTKYERARVLGTRALQIR